MIKSTSTWLAGLMISSASFAQVTLQNGAAPITQVVSRPYLYYDLLRDQHPQWLRQYRQVEAQPWANNDFMISRKGTDGRFTHLEYSGWDFASSEWRIIGQYLYEHQYADGKITREQSQVTTGQVAYSTVTDFTHENNRLKQAFELRKDADGNPELEIDQFFFYNNEGQLIHDSSAISSSSSSHASRLVFEYNGPDNKCSRQELLVNTRQMNRVDYEYDNTPAHRLTRYTAYNTQGLTFITYEELFEYDAQGRVTKVVESYADNSGNFAPRYEYNHGYNGSKLQWMTSHAIDNNQLIKEDSVYITFTNDQADTSYGFLSADGMEWNSAPSLRFLFNSPAVGLKERQRAHIDFGLYPNPASQQVTISLHNNKQAKRIVITDLPGRTAASFSDVTNDQPLDISGLKTGIYLVRVETEEGLGIKKLVVE